MYLIKIKAINWRDLTSREPFNATFKLMMFLSGQMWKLPLLWRGIWLIKSKSALKWTGKRVREIKNLPEEREWLLWGKFHQEKRGKWRKTGEQQEELEWKSCRWEHSWGQKILRGRSGPRNSEYGKVGMTCLVCAGAREWGQWRGDSLLPVKTALACIWVRYCICLVWESCSV